MDRSSIYEGVTSRIVAALEAGTVPWRKPWRSAGGVPVSIRSGKPYRGVNVLILMLKARADPRWGTYKAIAEAGGQVRRGEKSTSVILWKPVKKKGEIPEGESAGYMLLRQYSVFNAGQADGLPELPVEEERQFTPIEEAELLFRGYVSDISNDNPGPPVRYGFDRAAYSPTQDVIVLPDPKQFDADESFYVTLFHELVHSTGHEGRLGRIESALFGTDPYAKEELVAEIGASFLAGMAEFETAGGEQSVAYIGGWLEKLKHDPKLIVQAAAQAQKAVDLIAGATFDEQPPVEREVVAA
jgi:antirestriction protein ArdC